MFLRLWLVLLVAVFAVVLVAFKKILNPPVPTIKEQIWGDDRGETIKPFEIQIKAEILEDLNHRLKTTRPLPPSLEQVNNTYGIHKDIVEDVLKYWRTEYNWREREKFLNQFPQFTVQIQGLRIHYLHVKPKLDAGSKVEVLPLLMLHGWPGSIREFYEVIPELIKPKDGYNYVFEVIAPSLPGFGFSDATRKPGLGLAHVCVLFKNFMKRLGYQKYYIHGGDWGAVIAQTMATLFPEYLHGIHSTMCVTNAFSEFKLMLASWTPSLVIRKEHEEKVYPLLSTYEFLLKESGYFHLQSTKPDAVGVALNESPIGLAAYILDKFISLTDPKYIHKPDGGLKEVFSYETLIDNLMIYWVTGTITSSMRIYAETFNKENQGLLIDFVPTEVPTACTRFSHELFYKPDCILKDKFHNLVYTNDLEGGHFSALQHPKLLAMEIFKSVDKMIEEESIKAKK
ncbi:juvenile hormone epoxide hydrolase 2 isoform X2 [Aethina tumida]|uniref:juvenile hormone epoxide hydrolase 2 isoform X2 n=1 Tax=Aethina tumida TaxID=116153 RepID=UPI002148FE6D|nr:juvenile hormone epoxide hydrolase 2 isoform X2 [Aethina tumida]